MKRKGIVAMNLSTVLLACLCVAATAADGPFQPLLDHLARQHGAWDIDNDKVAVAFYRCFDAIPKDKEKAVVEFVGNDNDRAYWVGRYLTESSYLHGHPPMPHLALAIWANASDRLAAARKLSHGDNTTSAASITSRPSKPSGLD